MLVILMAMGVKADVTNTVTTAYFVNGVSQTISRTYIIPGEYSPRTSSIPPYIGIGGTNYWHPHTNRWRGGHTNGSMGKLNLGAGTNAIRDWSISYTAMSATNGWRMMTSTQCTNQMEQSNITQDVIQELARSGKICKAIGHNWSYAGFNNGTPSEFCSICGVKRFQLVSPFTPFTPFTFTNSYPIITLPGTVINFNPSNLSPVKGSAP